MRKVLEHSVKYLSLIIADREEVLLDDTYLWGETKEM